MKDYEYITINKKSFRVDTYSVVVKNSFFDRGNEVVISINDGAIIFSYPDIDYVGKTYHFCNMDEFGWKTCSLTSELLSPGKYFIDKDESNEDQLVVCL